MKRKNEIDESLIGYGRMAMETIGKYTLENRAVPDFRDGLKPVQRRILWAAHKMGLSAKKKVYKKSARLVGDCFLEGTPVSMADGTKKAIEDVEVGDMVSTSMGDHQVTERYVMPPQPVYRVVIGDKEIVCTAGQRFKVKRGQEHVWIAATELQAGDQVLIE